MMAWAAFYSLSRGRASHLFPYSYGTIVQIRVKLFGRVLRFVLGPRILSLLGGSSYHFKMDLLIHSDQSYLLL
jgi:hypothetical protein